MKNKDLHVTVVTYDPDFATLSNTFNSLRASLLEASQKGFIANCCLSVVDNGPGDSHHPALRGMLDRLRVNTPGLAVKLYSGQGNIGYARGHNLAARTRNDDYLLVLNPDVILQENTLSEALLFMESHADVGLLTPYVTNKNGGREFMCKRYPSIVGLGLRGFAPALVKRIFHSTLARYEMRDLYVTDEVTYDIPIVSGCFMFCRYSVWQEIDGFSEHFFMYFEDFDFSLRLGEVAGIAYVPTVRITHLGGGASRKGWRHIRMFVRSGITFFNRHGWKIR